MHLSFSNNIINTPSSDYSNVGSKESLLTKTTTFTATPTISCASMMSMQKLSTKSAARHYRSKSTGTGAAVNKNSAGVVGTTRKHAMCRSRSLPKEVYYVSSSSSSSVTSKDQLATIHNGPQSSSCPPPPPLCRWSSCPPCEQILTSAVCMAPTRARSMRNMRILPPRLPIRRNGKAEELRSALPPRFPERKPGDATMDSNAMPPFMPKRFDDSFSDNLSLINLSSSATSTNSPSYSRCSTISSNSDDNDDLCSVLSSSDDDVAAKEGIIRNNLRNILGEVLGHLEFDEDF